MVKKAGKYFRCEECDLKYVDKEMSEKCEAWCSEYNSCNLEITKFALKQ